MQFSEWLSLLTFAFFLFKAFARARQSRCPCERIMHIPQTKHEAFSNPIFTVRAVGCWAAVFHAPLIDRLIRMLLFQAGMIFEAVVSALDDLAPFTQCHTMLDTNIRFLIILLSRPPKGHGDLDFASEENMIISRWEMDKVPGNLKMGTPNPISPVTQTSERLDHRYCGWSPLFQIRAYEMHTTTLQSPGLSPCQFPSQKCMQALQLLPA